VAAVAGLESGRLDLCALPTLAVDPVAPLTGAFRTAHPGVTVTLADAEGPAEVASLVTTGDAEVGITVEHAVNDALRSVTLGRQEMLVVLPPGTPITSSTRALPAEELASRPIVTTPRGTSTRQLLDEAFAAARVTPQIAVVTAQRSRLPLVLAGAGASLCRNRSRRMRVARCGGGSDAPASPRCRRRHRQRAVLRRPRPSSRCSSDLARVGDRKAVAPCRSRR
jgi:DNA-binding transcriptional LysR family regulator